MKFLDIKFLLLIFSLITHDIYANDTLEYNLVIKDHKFIPNVIHIPSGHKIILIVDNQDNTIEEFESIELKREKIIPAHQKIRVIFAPLRKGEYRFFGEFHEETAQGKIIVFDEKENDNIID